MSYTFTKYRYRIDIAIFGQYRIEIEIPISSYHQSLYSLVYYQPAVTVP